MIRSGFTITPQIRHKPLTSVSRINEKWINIDRVGLLLEAFDLMNKPTRPAWNELAPGHSTGE
jgi:hypothetical protein